MQKEYVLFALNALKEILKYCPDTIVSQSLRRCMELSERLIYNNENVADELYEYLDNEEYGFSVMQENENDNMMIVLLDCIIDSIGIITRYAYDSINQKYYPEPIELVSKDTYKHLKIALKELSEYGVNIDI